MHRKNTSKVSTDRISTAAVGTLLPRYYFPTAVLVHPFKKRYMYGVQLYYVRPYMYVPANQT